MGEIVHFDRDARRRNVPDEELFERWRLATLKAQASLDFDDAVAAGVAWREWLESFKAIRS